MNISSEIIDKAAFVKRHHNLSAFITFLFLSFYALNANPFAGETVAPFDRLLQFPGWFTTQSDRQAVHLERSDILDSQLPTWITLKDQIRRGDSPLWYPNGAGGQPISLELFNPTFLLFLAVEDNSLAYYLVGLAKLLISGFGCFLLLKSFLRWLPSVWGGIVFMLCGFNAAWFFWEQVATAMWVPWLLWASVMYLKSEDLRWLPAITMFSLLLIFGGFFAVAGFGFYSFTLLILFWNASDFFGRNGREAFRTTDVRTHLTRKTALPLLAVGIAFIMAAVTLIPFKDSLSGINLGYRMSGGMPLRIHDLRLFFRYDEPPKVETTAYAGVLACILALAGLVAAFRGKDRDLRLFAFFNVLLIGISISFAFGLLPHRFIESLPVFKSNPKWGRLIVVTLLGLASLSAVGLDYSAGKLEALAGRYPKLTHLNARRVITLMLVVIISVQFHSQKGLFTKFNAVVPAAWFYPQTPSLTYVKENLKPLQSVIADNSYWFAGTLGAYGIPEWYAHSFRTDREKEVLGELVLNPSSSPTSMFISGNNIQFSSPLMDKLAIKYLLVGKTALDTKHLYAFPVVSHDLAPPLPLNSWRQHIYLPNDIFVGVFGFSFATFGEARSPANVRLTLYAEDGSQYSVQPERNKNEIAENEWVSFEFPNPFFMKKGGYYIVLSLPGYSGPGKLAALATKTQGNTGSFLEVNGAKTDYSLAWKVGYYEKKDLSEFADKWNLIELENNIILFENKKVTSGAYFVKDLTASNDQIDFSGLDISRPSVSLIDIRYSNNGKGWIVLPMHLHPDWKASVNDRQVGYDTYLGMLPAIPVEGASHIVFSYQAGSFRRGLTVSVAGVFIFLLFLGYCYKKAKQKT